MDFMYITKVVSSLKISGKNLPTWSICLQWLLTYCPGMTSFLEHLFMLGIKTGNIVTHINLSPVVPNKVWSTKGFSTNTYTLWNTCLTCLVSYDLNHWALHCTALHCMFYIFLNQEELNLNFRRCFKIIDQDFRDYIL